MWASGITSFFQLRQAALLIAIVGVLTGYRLWAQAPSDEIEQHKAALHRATRTHDKTAQANELQALGESFRSIGESNKASDYLNRALKIERELHDESGEATTLTSLGGLENDTGNSKAALQVLEQALAIKQRLGDPKGEAAALTAIGEVYWSEGDPQHALEFHSQALDIEEQVSDNRGQGVTLSDLGVCYWGTGDPGKAIQYYKRAITYEREANDSSDEAVTLHSIGVALEALDRLQEALEYFKQALPIEEQTGNRRAEAGTAQEIGTVYQSLGLPHDALRYFKQSAIKAQQVGDRATEATALNAVGSAYTDVGQSKDALKSYMKALALEQAVASLRSEAITLNNVGVTFQNAGKPDQALRNFQQSLALAKQTGNLTSEAFTTWHIASLESTGAIQGYLRAVYLARQVGDLSLQGQINKSLMLHFRKLDQPAIAIFFGKEAVNNFQAIRANLKGLDRDLQRSFISSKEQLYRDLANLLIAQGRLPEAQEVLDLLKQQEYEDFVRNRKTNSAGAIVLTPAEQLAEQQYQESTLRVVSISTQWTTLRKVEKRTAEQDAKFQQLSEALSVATQGLNDCLTRLYELLGKTNDANRQITDIKGNAAVLRQQVSQTPHTVALYTIVTPDRYTVLVIAGSAMVARARVISDNELSRKIALFRQLLRDPHQDPKPLAHELYDILIGPVKADLDQANAEHLIWSLDGVLRYIPMAALYDGQQYLVEHYSVTTFTPASISHFADSPTAKHVNALGMGISRKYEQDLDALPAVPTELNEIVRDNQREGANGVLPGAILLDGQFTERAMEEALNGEHSVVHIASHFVFKPGDDSESYLLLAGKENDDAGYHLTLAEFRNDQKLNLDDTDLLTLSACETGLAGTTSNGREVDGLATTAQLKGARAVLSSLWSVNDASTGKLMADLYRRWVQGGGQVSKGEALRQAQLDLLKGSIRPSPDYSNQNMSFAHPYYWASFVLTGNWR